MGGVQGGAAPPIYVRHRRFFFEMSSRLCISFTFCRSVHCHNILEANGGLDRPSPASTCMHAALSVMPVNHSINITVAPRRRLRNRLRRLRNWWGAAAGLRNQTPCFRPVFLTPGGYCSSFNSRPYVLYFFTPAAQPFSVIREQRGLSHDHRYCDGVLG